MVASPPCFDVFAIWRVDSTPGENGSEAWRRLVQRFDPASAHANVNLMSKILKPPKGKVESISFLMEKSDEMVRRPDERIRRQALTDDSKRAIMMGMCPPELQRHLVLNFDRYDTYPKVRSAIQDYVEQMRHGCPLAKRNGWGTCVQHITVLSNARPGLQRSGVPEARHCAAGRCNPGRARWNAQ